MFLLRSLKCSSNKEKFCSARKNIRANTGAKLRTFLDIKSKYLYYIIILLLKILLLFIHLDRLHLRGKKGCDVQNMVITVIIKEGSDVVWGHLARSAFTLQTGVRRKYNYILLITGILSSRIIQVFAQIKFVLFYLSTYKIKFFCTFTRVKLKKQYFYWSNIL